MDESTHTGRARQRQRAREHRRNRQPMVAKKTDDGTSSATVVNWRDVILSFVDQFHNQSKAIKIILIPIFFFFALFILNLIFGSRVPPNVFILDQPLGGMQYTEAAKQLETTWSQDTLIRLVTDDLDWFVTPAELGIDLDARASVEATNGIGLAGLPFGYWIEPALSINRNTMQKYLKDLASDIYIAPTNARYEWVDGAVQGISGQNGLQLDVVATIDSIQRQPFEVLGSDIELVTNMISPTVNQPGAYLPLIQEMIIAPFELVAYNPFQDSRITFVPDPQILTSWFEAGETGLIIRENPLTDYITFLNEDPASGLPDGAYLNPEEVLLAIRQSIIETSMQAFTTVRFYPSTYEVVAGDTGFKISRKTGIPFFLIEEVNPDIDLSILSPGDVINLPSRDVTVPLPIVSNKRIIVDLVTQSMVAYEDSQVVFSWQISSGIADAPTSPGIYQILSHESVAYGSSYTLCGDTGCGQWELNWFMGIYEVVPGLVNGFHGAVLLPNGAYLGGNNVGAPYTLGCVMSTDEQARQLYDWAELGTIVEIISDEFSPKSELARRAFDI